MEVEWSRETCSRPRHPGDVVTADDPARPANCRNSQGWSPTAYPFPTSESCLPGPAVGSRFPAVSAARSRELLRVEPHELFPGSPCGPALMVQGIRGLLTRALRSLPARVRDRCPPLPPQDTGACPLVRRKECEQTENAGRA